MFDLEGLHAVANTSKLERKADIIFVHGLGGSSHSTWRHGKPGSLDYFFWPEELGKDLPDFGIWTVGYPAGITELGKPGMIIESRAGNLAQRLANAGLGKLPLVFVCHSLGGLIIKSLLVSSQTQADPDRKNLANMVRAIVFCGTPHRGSTFASAANVLGKLLGGSQKHVIEMRANAEPLDILHDAFIEWHRKHTIPVQSYAENVGLFRKNWFGRPIPLGQVVPRASANPGIAGDTVRVVDEDHLTLVKPRNRNHVVYAGVVRFVSEALNPKQQVPDAVRPPVVEIVVDATEFPISHDVRANSTPTVNEPDYTDDELIKQIGDRDPLRAKYAFKYLKDRPDLLPLVIEQGCADLVGEDAVRKLLRIYPEQSANILMERLRQAGPGQLWHIARRSTAFFDLIHAPVCEAELSTIIKRFSGCNELIQLSIEALGRCGSSGWGYDLRKLLEDNDDYLLEKFGSWVLDALARMFLRSEGKEEISYASDKLCNEIIHLVQHSRDALFWSSVPKILYRCEGRHADPLIQTWLNSDSSDVAQIAAGTLGMCRIARAAKPLIETIEKHRADENLVRVCSEALGNIGTGDAIEWLLSQPERSATGIGLAHALHKITDATIFRQAMARVIANNWGNDPCRLLALSAVGRKRADELTSVVQKSLSASLPIERGIATLALARAEKIVNTGDAIRVIEQAADHNERVFAALAVLSLDAASFSVLEEQLRLDLGKCCLHYLPALQQDILDVLDGTHDENAIELANAWRPYCYATGR